MTRELGQCQVKATGESPSPFTSLFSCNKHSTEECEITDSRKTSAFVEFKAKLIIEKILLVFKHAKVNPCRHLKGEKQVNKLYMDKIYGLE